MTLNRAVLKRMPWIVHQVPVVCCRNSCSKKIRIVCRLTYQCEHFPRPRIQGDDGTHLFSDSIFGSALKIEIDGCDQIVAGNIGFFPSFLLLPTEAIDHDPLKSIFSDEYAVVLSFEAGLADLITRFEVDKLRCCKFRFCDLADVPHGMSSQ